MPTLPQIYILMYAMVWYVMACNGTVWYAMVHSGHYGMLWYAVVRHFWCGMLAYGMVLHATICYTLRWCAMVWYEVV